MASGHLVRGRAAFSDLLRDVIIAKPMIIPEFPRDRRTPVGRRVQLVRPDYAPDRGAFAALSPNTDSYKSPATPATIAVSAKLKTYQLKWMLCVVM